MVARAARRGGEGRAGVKSGRSVALLDELAETAVSRGRACGRSGGGRGARAEADPAPGRRGE